MASIQRNISEWLSSEDAAVYQQYLRDELAFARTPPSPCPNHNPPWHYISNHSCKEGCSWRTGPDCIQCVFVGAWISCECFFVLRGHANLYGEDYVHFEEKQKRMVRQWEKRTWLIVHPTANLQRERNIFRASQLWKVLGVSDMLNLVGSFYSAGITIDDPVCELS